MQGTHSDNDSHWQPQLPSHDQWHRRLDSSSSEDSSASSYSNGPSFDCHISISSTIYPASSAESFLDMHHRLSSVKFSQKSPSHDSLDKISPSSSPSSSEIFGHSLHVTSHPPPCYTSSQLPNGCPVILGSSEKASPSQGNIDLYCTDPVSHMNNFLDQDERSELIRKNKKLIRLLGQSPGPDVLSQQDAGWRLKWTMGLPDHHTIPPAQPEHCVQKLETSTCNDSAFCSDEPSSKSEYLSSRDVDKISGVVSLSPPSTFIALSDDLGSATPKSAGESRDCSLTLFEDLSVEEQADELRRRKREKLARLHRFLGFQVPVNLALGLDDDIEDSLPPVQPDVMPHGEGKKAAFRRRRCSSADPYTSSWVDDVDRLKEDLNVKEKAINVRRAQKMEKVFGVAPPQTLYHTRRPPSHIVAHAMTHSITDPGPKPDKAFSSKDQQEVSPEPSPDKTSHFRTTDSHPLTSDSKRYLLPKEPDRRADCPAEPRRRTSIVYSNYQESLNSLSDIIDQDDRESLAELCEYLSSGNMNVPPPSPTLQNITRTASGDRRLSNASSIISERRLSLPTSISSFSSDLSAASPRPEVSGFQIRRRRAAKLTQFFGVNYRELITDVFESIERGVEHEHRCGTLNQDEAQDLLACLRKLRNKRQVI